MAASAAFGVLRAGTSHAAEIACGTEHEVKPGETLSRLALKAYGDRLRWPAIVEANKERLRPALIAPGQRLFIPCLDAAGTGGGPAAETASEGQDATSGTNSSSAPSDTALIESDAPQTGGVPAPVEVGTSAVAAVTPSVDAPTAKQIEPLTQINLLTSDNFVPFADRGLLNGGLITELITEALRRDAQTAQLPQQLFWINDRRTHQELLAGSATFAIGFPWVRLDCTELDSVPPATRLLCERFHFSEPLVEEMNRLFALRTSNFAFATDNEILGKRICASTDREIGDLDSNGRDWVASDKIVLLRPSSEVECFRMLKDGEVDAVYAPELVGLAVLDRLDLRPDVKALQRPVSIVTFGAIVPRNHPHADEIIRSINSGIALLRSTDTYDTIVAHHLEQFWDTRQAD